MSNGTSNTGADQPQVAGPAAVAGALRVLDRHARTMVKLSITAQAVTGNDLAAGVAAEHDRVAHTLHEISLEHGTDAMNTAAEYAACALEAGSLYHGEELDTFMRDVAVSVRNTSRELTKHTPFGG